MSETKSIMIVGVGGQGTLLTSRILGGLALENGFDVKISEVHGMSQRGGSVVTYVRYGKEVAENIRDNCQTWIYLKTASNETASIISKKLGTYTTSSYSRSSSYTKYQSGSNSESMNLISRALLTEDEILRIERPYVLVIQAGLYPIITKLPDISKWRFNKLFGMGNQEENRQLRLEREQAREQKEIEDIKLWGIWNLYR